MPDITFSRMMASTSSTGVEIRKFDDKNIALWKEMMQDVLIIRRQIEAIQHNNKSTKMSVIEWRSLDEIARSTIRMHLVQNVYFKMAKEMIAYALWEKLQVCIQKEVELVKTHIDSIVIQYEHESNRASVVWFLTHDMKTTKIIT